MLNKYEAIFILDSDLGEDKIQALVEKFKNLLETSAQLESIDEWGKRKLAYLIQDKSEGYYVLVNFSSEPDFPKEFERNLKITDGVLKYMIIRKND
jgi:small subunit ribosomal protein S6